MTEMAAYRLELFRLGFLGRAEAHPLRRVQALLRAQACDREALEIWRQSVPQSVEVLDKPLRPW
jgi:hypothetical protein